MLLLEEFGVALFDVTFCRFDALFCGVGDLELFGFCYAHFFCLNGLFFIVIEVPSSGMVKIYY